MASIREKRGKPAPGAPGAPELDPDLVIDHAAAWPLPHLATLLAMRSFSVGEFRCPGHPELTEPESAPHPEIVIPRLGSYLRIDETGEVLLSRTTLAFFEPHRPYRIRHFRQAPDLTTVISITDAESLHEALGIRLATGRTFARAAIRMPPELIVLHRQMLRHLRFGVDGRLAAEEVATRIIMRAIALNVEDDRELTRAEARPRAGNDPYVAAEAVMQFLATSFPRRVTLEDVAIEVKLSPFHLCRLFQAVTGGTIHQHLSSLRLEAAVMQLLETRHSITAIAHAVGFSSHSHLTALFSRTFGVPPSALRSDDAIKDRILADIDAAK